MPSYGLLSLVASVALGALGWIATNFIARSILRVYELRERVWEELLVSAKCVGLQWPGLFARRREPAAVRGASVGARCRMAAHSAMGVAHAAAV